MLVLAMAFPMIANNRFERGDVNQDGVTSIKDVTILIDYLLSNEWPAPSGPVHEFVDLGLSSGTLWATTNVGATNPQDYGDYFAWGETVSKDTTYTWKTTAWVYYEGSSLRFSKYNTSEQYGEIDNKTELDPEDDAAYVNMGSEWRMPSKADIDELLANCTWEWTQLNGVNGQLITGPNGNTMFLPAVGERTGTSMYHLGEAGNYWSRSLHVVNETVSFPTGAFKIYLTDAGLTWNTSERCIGLPVRAVRIVQD